MSEILSESTVGWEELYDPNHYLAEWTTSELLAREEKVEADDEQDSE